jgi:cytidine deaminase
MAKELKNIMISLEVYENEGELDEKDQHLILQAKEAAENAYAPYSKFKVGAALELDNGIIITGNNQENAAYPSGLCAERTAVFYASSQYPHQKIRTVAIVAQNNSSEPVTPCGACRQTMAEFETKFKQPVRVIMASAKGKIYVSNNVENLLPLQFDSDCLK